MRITCKSNKGDGLPEKYFREGYTRESEFHLVIGKNYTVFGMALWRSVLVLLLLDEDHLPNWYPIDLFSVEDPRLPESWFFASYQGNELLVQALWGYERLVCDSSHHDALSDREPNAMKLFFEEVRRRCESEPSTM
jgi:hypothetical protein